MSHKSISCLIGLLALPVLTMAFSQTAIARSSDRNKPMDIDAGQTSGTLDDSVPTVMSRGVRIDQGTLHIDAIKAVLTTRGGEVVRAVLTGSPTKLKQQLDDGTSMDAAANTVDYNMQTEVVTFTGSVLIKQPRGSLSGERVVYNMRTGQVDSGGQGAGRVKMRILPRNGGSASAAEPAEPASKADDASPNNAGADVPEGG